MKSFFVLSLLLVTGCAEIGQSFNYDAVSQIKNGMGKEEVVARLGAQPSATSTQMGAQGNVECLGWTYAIGVVTYAESVSATICFLNGKVISVSQSQTQTS